MDKSEIRNPVEIKLPNNSGKGICLYQELMLGLHQYYCTGYCFIQIYSIFVSGQTYPSWTTTIYFVLGCDDADFKEKTSKYFLLVCFNMDVKSCTYIQILLGDMWMYNNKMAARAGHLD